MAKNKLSDVNDYLFAQLERFDDENLTGDALKLEIEKSRQIVAVSSQIIKNAKVLLDAVKVANDGGIKVIPPQFGLTQKNP